MQMTAQYPQVLEIAKRLAAQNPEKVSRHHMYKFTHDTVNSPEPYDFIAHIFEEVGFKPSPQWLWDNNHRVARSWMSDLIADWAVQVFFSRLQRATDLGLTWARAVARAESQTKTYYRSFAAQGMIRLMMEEHYYPNSTKPEDVLK